MTTIDRDRNNSGRCHTEKAHPLMSLVDTFTEARMCAEAGHEFSDTAAATVASWWHGPSGRGAVFSKLSHRIPGGVGVAELHDAIYEAQRDLDAEQREARRTGTDADRIESHRQALNMLSTWAMNGPGIC